ncbi:uroporphyrinogen-III synthase [Pasteurella atlantica]|uniref:Uroporphyrinogen-III synthase n=2 Tax=Pasteurellaceae TaxID=712 RepID=A0ACC6HMG2_9PAST|nr:uroporphyrinogen-III synthase [Pasteurella atlantica]MDP8033214.1 uroporphyrinogen-III synthase [Pasteurella atlantica]MDP8035236.1 uroporphyrinogen-III synthase [Pasteurella atlantica]MDP8037186.1 uroporphyrinogen-III synthase [Pasteurella atlantica]MDP8047373.1 uroporphyrinogen-III synthase [Pasteurella atlantica]MDP8049403.1 uroporphyrinogen-III synthase [Pasteurella atlantica]
MKVLVTRPEKVGEELTEMLQHHNISAIHYSPFDIVGGRELSQLPSVLASLTSNDYVLSVSKNAIYFAHHILAQNNIKWRDDLKYFAIGKASANYFSALSKQAVRYPIKFANSETFLALPEMERVMHKNFIILRAETGRELISTEITKRGARVKSIECYCRLTKKDINAKISFFKQARIDTLIISSCDILNTLLKQTSLQDRKWLIQCLLIVVSERIAKYAVSVGWRRDNIIISTQVNNHSLLETVITYHNQ